MRASRHIRDLLDTLCVELGFCLPPAEQEAILADPPSDVDRFVERVFRAEGLDPPSGGELYAQVRQRVAPVLEAVHFMSVTWPDGSVIAEVSLYPTCDPLHVPHIVGTFTRGPGFERLVPYLDEINQHLRDREVEAAFRVSEHVDELGITATDDLGRLYDLFNVVFDEHGLLFSVTWVKPEGT